MLQLVLQLFISVLVVEGGCSEEVLNWYLKCLQLRLSHCSEAAQQYLSSVTLAILSMSSWNRRPLSFLISVFYQGSVQFRYKETMERRPPDVRLEQLCF